MRWFAIVLSVALVGALAPRADAGKPKKKSSGSQVSKKLGGLIYSSNKRFPTSAKSEAAFISKIKSNKKDKVWEDKANKEWHLYCAAFFRKPLSDLNYTVKIYDITEGGQEYKDTIDQFADSADQPSVNFDLELPRGDKYPPNRKLLIVVEDANKIVASGRVQIVGEYDKYSGKVDFSKDDGDGDSGSDAKTTDTDDSSDGTAAKPKKGTK